MASTNKSQSKKTIHEQVYSDGEWWTVQCGELKRTSLGRPQSTEHLFKVVGEKLPFDSLPKVKKHLVKFGYSTH